MDRIQAGRLLFFVGDDCPTWAESLPRAGTACCSSADPRVPLSERRGRGHLLLLRHHGLSQGDPPQPREPHAGRRDGAAPPRPDPRRRVPVHPAALPHGRHACTGWAACSWAGAACCCAASRPRPCSRPSSSEGCTIVWLLVPWAQDILVAIEEGAVRLEDYHLDQWRLMHIGAQPVPASLIQRWRAVFPHHDYDTNYGLSESMGPGCVHLGVENIDHVGAIGVPGYRWECKIVDERGAEVGDGRGRRALRQGPRPHGVLLQGPRGHGGDARRRLAPHRGHGPAATRRGSTGSSTARRTSSSRAARTSTRCRSRTTSWVTPRSRTWP